MHLGEIIAPLDVERFRSELFGKRSFAIVRDGNPVEGILTLDEIEARLNDGMGQVSPLAVIGPNGAKLPPRDLYVEPGGRTWSPRFLQKARLRALLEAKHSFVIHNLSQVNPRVDALIASIEEAFPGFHADLHLYVSPAANGTAYNVHRDEPQHKIYVQLVGTTRWTVYAGDGPAVAMTVEEASRTLRVEFEETLRPGSVLYMPPRVYHRVTNPDGPRVSLSIPFFEDRSRPRVDRTYVPFRRMFEGGAG